MSGTNQLDILGELEKKDYTKEQSDFIYLPKGHGSIILSSTAGSGKTFCCIERLRYLIEKEKVDPSKVIFFSFTNSAVDELKERLGNDKVEITTIHSFCAKVLSNLKKMRKISSFVDFIKWYKTKYKPKRHDSEKKKEQFYRAIDELYEESNTISSHISAFKLQQEDGIRAYPPKYIDEYKRFQKERKVMDFSDMIINVKRLFEEDRYLKRFKNRYDHIFVDEYQDTSSIQMKILLALNAKYYYLIGDRNQSIYGYSGANCKKIEEMLEEMRDTKRMNLSVNFRSAKKIIENSNEYTDLKAVPSDNKVEDGHVDNNIIYSLDDLINIIRSESELAILCRRNSTIKKLEFELLKRRIPIKYFNYITEKDIKKIKDSKVDSILEKKLSYLKGYFSTNEDLYSFIRSNERSTRSITTVHKSKGLEYESCVAVNSLSPEILEKNGVYNKLSKKQFSRISFKEDDTESKNIHYVAITRSKKNLYYMIYDH